jgi:hypothetical protein
VTKANEIRGGVLPAGPATIQENEAERVAQQAQKQKISQADQARIAQQAGFVKAQQKKKPKGFDIGDSSHSPIPLPEDDIDPEQWSAEKLDGAQQNLGLASAQFREVAAEESPNVDLAGSVVGSSFLPTEEDLADLEDLAKRPAPQPIPLEEVTTNVERLFHIKLDQDIPAGHKLLAAGLVAAGELGSVSVDKGRLDEKKLAAGIQKITEKSNQAVGEAQKMSKGIGRELNVQRTFVHKR